MLSLILLPFAQWFRYGIYALSIPGLYLIIRSGVQVKFTRLILVSLLMLTLIWGAVFDVHYQLAESLASGALHNDIAFDSAIIAMYKNYQISSVGLDGLVPIAYHTLSYEILAGLSLLSGLSAVETLAYVYFSLGPVTVIFALAGLTKAFLNSFELSFDKALLGVICCLGVIQIVPIFVSVGLFDSFFDFKSFLCSLGLLSMSLFALRAFVDKRRSIDLAISLVLMYFAGRAKGSIGLVSICIYFYFLVFVVRKDKTYIALVTIYAIAMYFTLVGSATNAKALDDIKPFGFVLDYVQGPNSESFIPVKIARYVCFHYLSVWFAFWLGVRAEGRAYFRSFEFGVLISLLLPSMFIALTFDIQGGGAMYFSWIPVMIGIVAVVARVMPSIPWPGTRYSTLLVTIPLALSADSIYDKSFAKAARNGYTHDLEIEAMTRQLIGLRDSLPIKAIVHVSNPERLIKKLGCKAYWNLPGLLERPMLNGLPEPESCQELCAQVNQNMLMLHGSRNIQACRFEVAYGLLDYLKTTSLVPDGFQVYRLKLTGPPGFPEVKAIRGMLAAEGPYPKWNLPVIRWMNEPDAIINFDVDQSGPGELKFRAQSPVDGQMVSVSVDGVEIGTCALGAAYHATDCAMSIAFLSKDSEVDFHSRVVVPDAIEGRTVLFHGIAFSPRSASGFDLPTTK